MVLLIYFGLDLFLFVILFFTKTTYSLIWSATLQAPQRKALRRNPADHRFPHPHQLA